MSSPSRPGWLRTTALSPTGVPSLAPMLTWMLTHRWRRGLWTCLLAVVLSACGQRVGDVESRMGLVTAVKPLPDGRYQYEAKMQDDGSVRTDVTEVEIRKGWIVIIENGRLVKATGFTGRRAMRRR